MTALPSSVGRTSNILFTQLSLGSLNRTNLALLSVQNQLSTGRSVLRPSDDSVRAATISVLDARLESLQQRQRNLDNASASLAQIDEAFRQASDLVNQAKEIASNQVNLGSTADERAQQAQVVDSLIDSLFKAINTRAANGYLFAGSRTSEAPLLEFAGGYRYTGDGSGLITDLGLGDSVPITLGAGLGLGETSARVRSSVDLNPDLTPDTRLADLRGARGQGIAKAAIEFSYQGGPRTTIDLATADTAGDVADRITAAIRQYESDNALTILGPGAVSFSAGALTLDVLPDPPNPDPQLQFFDPAAATTAQDLGLADDAGRVFTAAATTGADTDPKLTWRTPIAALSALTAPLTGLRLSNNSVTTDLDLSAATTVQDIASAIEAAGLGLRVVLNDDATAFDVLNEVAAGPNRAFSISEIPDGARTATRLGIRTFDTSTRLADFNDARGVQIADGAVDPVTGLPDPDRNLDFAITLGNGARLTVDLRPQDLATVQTVLDRINDQAADQAAALGLTLPADFQATLSDGPNGIALRQNPAFPDPIRLERLNDSPAAEHLGLLTGTYDPATSTWQGDDHAQVRVDNLLTALIDLREALLANDTRGITFAGEKLESSVDRLAESRGLAGAYARRVDDAAERETEIALNDEKVRASLRDLDYTEAAVKLSLLQTQLQAALTVTGRFQSQSLLDFLG